MLREAGVSETEAHEAYMALRRASAIALGGGGPQELTDALKLIRKYSALRRADMPNLTNGAYLRAFQTDPQWSISADLFLQALHVPTLAIFGEHDMQVDWREGIDVYHNAFVRGGNGDLTIKTFKDADHDVRPPLNNTRLRHSIFVDDYIETMIEWLRAHNFTAAKD